MLAPYGNTFALWKQGAGTRWQSYKHHPFVEGLSDGSLPRGAFIEYLTQDYIFLRHFARAWALAVVKSESLEEMRTAASTVDALINHEMQLHVTTCAKEGISEQALFDAEEHPANLAYTRFVMDAGFSGDFLDLIAALAPCVFGYAEIGIRLARQKTDDTIYAPWISTYADTDYQKVCSAVGAMLHGAVTLRLGANAETSARWPRLQAQFTKATQLEVDFWQLGIDHA